MEAIISIIAFILVLCYLTIEDKRKQKKEIQEVLDIESIKKDRTITSITDEVEIYFNEQEERFSKTYQQYLDTIEWKTLTFQIYKRDNNRCRQCSKDLSKINGNVHHVNYDNVYMEKLEDLVLVCKNCHQLIHSYYKHFSPSRKTFPLLSTQQYIEAIELSNTYIDKK